MLLQDLRRELPGFARRAPIVLAINTLIGVMMWLRMRPADLDVQLVYSHAIGTVSWLLIDVGRFFVGPKTTPHRFPHGWRKLPFLASGVLIGYVVGTSVGDAYSGRSTWELMTRSPAAFLSLTLGSVVVGSIIVYIFYSRGELAHHRAEAEAARRQAAENQLKLLESQLEPHMLFNTLANLRALIGVDPQRAQTMLDRMIAFLRATLNASRSDTHPLQLEFARLADYLELMRIRMGDRLAMQLDLPDPLAPLPVPPLLLQPLVENAIKHGLEPSVEGGRIEVGARRDGDLLVLTVRDTGVGAPAAVMPPQGAGFGLDQVRQRIATVYGARASLSMTAATDGRGGMLAIVTLPIPSAPTGSAAARAGL